MGSLTWVRWQKEDGDLGSYTLFSNLLHDEYWWGERVKMWVGGEGVSVLSIQEA